MRALATVCVLLTVIVLGPACGSVPSETPDGADATSTDDGAAGSPDAPLVDALTLPDGFTCSPNTFYACDRNELVTCDDDGTGVERDPCGDAGCNPVAERCNQCRPSTHSCADGNEVLCDADGIIATRTACFGGCQPGGDHCAALDPVFLPGICDAPGAGDTVVPAGSTRWATGGGTTCNGGLIAQPDGSTVCVMRVATLSVAAGATLSVTGANAFAVVADQTITLSGEIDASANQQFSGAGAQTRVNGGGAGVAGGGGGGHGTDGGSGGGTIGGPGGGARGTATPLVDSLIAGSHAGDPATGSSAHSGGGGGGLMFVSCRGSVTMTSGAVIDVGGGGGGAGFIAATGLPMGGGGGGSGGTVVFQGLGVSITGSIWANGGSGGGGTAAGAAAEAGANGSRSTFTPGGSGAGAGGEGGSGGGSGGGAISGGAPSTPSGSPGGGGGAAGRIKIYVPTGTPVATGGTQSPAFEPTGVAPTK